MNEPVSAGTDRTAGPAPGPGALPDAAPDAGPDLSPNTRPDLGPDGACVPGSRVPCVCDNGLPGNQICLPSLVYGECGCGTEALMRVKDGMIGEWLGTVATPWLSPYPVTFRFDSYTHYSARSLDAFASALYFGTDDDTPDKRYSVDDVRTDGDAVGTIDIHFGVDYVVVNKLEGIALSTDLNHLVFSYTHVGQYGPLQYDLQRAIP